MNMEERILFVDDDLNVLEAYQRKLQHVLHVRTAQGPHLGFREIKEKGPFAVVISDMNMPIMNGIEFLRRVRELAPDTVRMMLTGNNDIRVAMDAVNEGSVFRFLMKPCPTKLMGDSLVAAIKQYRLIRAEKDILEETLQRTVELLAEILSWVSPDAFGRTMHVRNTVKHILEKMNVENPWAIELAATLCQIGLLAIPAEVLSKITRGEPLDDTERKALNSVPNMGHEMIGRIPRLEQVAEIILHQNKRYDEPEANLTDRLKIPIGSRVIKAVNDLYELQREGKCREEALKEMLSKEGWYDPKVLSSLGAVIATAAVHVPQEKRSISVSLADLKPGLTLAFPIMTAKGRKMIEAGTTISAPLLLRLKQYASLSGITEPIEVVLR